MSSEIDTQLWNHTWNLEPPAPNQNVTGNKWIFKLKYLPNGKIERYKARLVAKGFHQQQGIKYSEAFNPVIKSSTIQLVHKVPISSFVHSCSKIRVAKAPPS
ncbi:Retrovirus-related Pol polyprotein from transposon RE1 [Cardamine amara subsp. amara]|uniref:Retrovirus-related Pol polyprotein from transposon RE1 n=1 Tax=Cardamine amara subsp. amara TaxID=228776 RepID=A0ABD1C1D0_CARAN